MFFERVPSVWATQARAQAWAASSGDALLPLLASSPGDDAPHASVNDAVPTGGVDALLEISEQAAGVAAVAAAAVAAAGGDASRLVGAGAAASAVHQQEEGDEEGEALLVPALGVPVLEEARSAR